eukprot:jgi/Mesvir1/10181/Mv05156-RA.1
MPRYTTSQTFTESNTQVVLLPEPGLPDNKPKVDPSKENLEEKLRRIVDTVPGKLSSTSGSSAGSGSGDFHEYRGYRRKEIFRLNRMEAEYKQRMAEEGFQQRQQQRQQEAEERTAKKRAKRLKKKQKKKQRKGGEGGATEGGNASGDDGSSGDSEEDAPQEALD